MVHSLTTVRTYPVAGEADLRPRIFYLFLLHSGIVTQGLDFQPGHPLHWWLKFVSFGLDNSTLSSQLFSLHPSGNVLSIITNRVRNLEALWSNQNLYDIIFSLYDRTFVTAAFRLAISSRLARSASSIAWTWFLITSSKHLAPVRRSFILSGLKTSLVT